MDQQATTDKRAYTTPALTVHGAVQDLTRVPPPITDASCPIGV